MTRRVAITGVGALTSVGHTATQAWDSIKNGISGAGKITRFDASTHNVQIACEIKDWNAGDYMSAKELRRHDRYQHYAFAVSKEALAQADWNITTEDERSRTSVVVGSSVGGVESHRENMLIVHETHDLRKISPFGIPMFVANGASNMLSIHIGAHGPSQTLVSACATGADCIGYAFDLIRNGRIDRALAGCSEAPISDLGIGGFDRIGAASRNNDDPVGAMRPFAKDRTGLVFGEGAGVLVLEEYESAKKRGAVILAELCGYASTSDAFHLTAPDPDALGAVQAMRLALESAGINADQIDHINAHGTATALNDPMETKAMKQVFGDHAYQIAISATKSMTGHGMGMTAALEAVWCVMALRDQIAPPTINLHEKDSECDLDYVPLVGREVKMIYAMSNAFGFGGHNASLIFKKAE
ncbi:MAG: beta-ketoacyl-ACP synthase II [Phototrophicales bacterium]|nr:beta-ketoacyl-ACP synthase II [Phototrophicales bacterium]